MQDLNNYKKKWFDYLGYKPHAGQDKLHFPTKESARFFVMVCGRRFGKTTASAMEATFYASQPNKRIWLVGLSYDKADLMFREIWQLMVIGRSNDVIKASEKERYIKFKWGTTVEAKSADNPDSLVGEGLDLLIIDEAAKVKPRIWDMYLSPTLSDRKGKGIFISTPEGFNWLYDLFLLGKSDELWESHQAPSWDNQYSFPKGQSDQFLIERKRNMSKELFDQEYGAQFTSFEGRVYPFDRNIDVGYYPYNPHLPTFCSIDFGYRMPSVGWYQTYRVNGEWHINMIDEIIHQTNMKTDELVQMIKSKPYRVGRYYGDPAGLQASSQSGVGDIEIFRKMGIVVNTITDKASGDTDFRCDRVGRYTKLRAENWQTETFCALVHKEHVSIGIEGDRAPNDSSCI